MPYIGGTRARAVLLHRTEGPRFHTVKSRPRAARRRRADQSPCQQHQFRPFPVPPIHASLLATRADEPEQQPPCLVLGAARVGATAGLEARATGSPRVGTTRGPWRVERGRGLASADVRLRMCTRDSAGPHRRERGEGVRLRSIAGRCSRSGSVRGLGGRAPSVAVILMCMCLILIACTVYDAGDEGSLGDARLERVERAGRFRR